MADALRIAVLGAESTGKTTLAAALAEALRQRHALRVAWVPELLRDWCTHNGRTPLAHEQGPILRAQHERIEAAAAAHDLVVCDTTALMTAVYSALIFGDHSLDARAVQLHRRMSFSLLMALDLPWVADGLQRDGPQVQQPVDALLRRHLQANRLPFAEISGHGEARLRKALAAVEPLLAGADARPPDAQEPGRGLFGGLAQRHTKADGAGRRWTCACCATEDPQAPAADRARA